MRKAEDTETLSKPFQNEDILVVHSASYVTMLEESLSQGNFRQTSFLITSLWQLPPEVILKYPNLWNRIFLAEANSIFPCHIIFT